MRQGAVAFFMLVMTKFKKYKQKRLTGAGNSPYSSTDQEVYFRIHLKKTYTQVEHIRRFHTKSQSKDGLRKKATG